MSGDAKHSTVIDHMTPLMSLRIISSPKTGSRAIARGLPGDGLGDDQRAMHRAKEGSDFDRFWPGVSLRTTVASGLWGWTGPARVQGRRRSLAVLRPVGRGAKLN